VEALRVAGSAERDRSPARVACDRAAQAAEIEWGELAEQ
jgi:hypothetical protein